jgi:hypothetical protein
LISIEVRCSNSRLHRVNAPANGEFSEDDTNAVLQCGLTIAAASDETARETGNRRHGALFNRTQEHGNEPNEEVTDQKLI